MKATKRLKRQRTTNRRRRAGIAALLPKGNAAWLFAGPHWGWATNNVPQGYLEWVSRTVDNLEQRDAADVELFRRRNTSR